MFESNRTSCSYVLRALVRLEIKFSITDVSNVWKERAAQEAACDRARTLEVVVK